MITLYAKHSKILIYFEGYLNIVNICLYLKERP
jgi:hypothetical protein